jgi:tetratricopeptide (TPR) repeat protein
MKSRNQTPGVAPSASAWSATIRATRWTVGQGFARIAIGSVVLSVLGCSIGLLIARPRLFPDPLAHGRRAYDRSDWSAAARSAREVLSVRTSDPAALRLLARSSIQLGRDDVALGIYTRGLEANAFEAQDYLLMGLALKRRGREDGAMWSWSKAIDTKPVTAQTLDQLAQLFCKQAVETEDPESLRPHPLDEAARAAERLRRQPGWESRGDLILGMVRRDSLNLTGAAEAFRSALNRDPKAADSTEGPVKYRKLFARTFLGVGRPAEALPHLQSILARGADPEASWLLSRVYLQQGAIAEAREVLGSAESYRRDNPLDDEPSPYLGEARCQKCHPAVFHDSLANRHTQTYYRGAQLRDLPRPDRPLADPTDPKATHTVKEADGALWEETRVGSVALRSLIEYAFGTSDRYFTMVSRDARDQYRVARLSYYHTAEGQGWARTMLDVDDPTKTKDFQGQTISARDGVVKCLYCHTTYARAGPDRTGPETADRAIGCERCHGPGGNHVAAVAAGFPDLAIVSPASASPQAVTQERCNDCHILDRRYRHGDPEKPGWIRSQGAGWSWSQCNIKSGGRFGCVTCHDPHRGMQSTTTAQYEAKCLTCHSATTVQTAGGPAPRTRDATERRPSVCSVDPAKGCIKCHMPGVRIDSAHREMTDHYIRRPRRTLDKGDLERALAP